MFFPRTPLPPPPIVKLVVVRRGEPITEDQLNSALRVGDLTPWWLALIQIIDDSRNDFALRMPKNAETNNPLEMARDAGAYEALSGLLVELERRRTSVES